MALAVEIQMEGFAELDALWQQAPDITREVLDSVTREASEFLEGEIKDLTPIGASGGGGGGLRDSIKAQEPEVLANNVLGVVGTASPHAIPVELGTKPHFPPVEPLIDWVRAKLDVPEKDVHHVAFQIARKISWRGTIAVGMFHRAFSMNETQLKNKYSHAAARIIEQLGEVN